MKVDLKEQGRTSGKHDHVFRNPLPWRSAEDALTECGLHAASYSTLTREEMQAKVKREGSTRAAMSSCMTCWNTVRDRLRIWPGVKPILEVVAREVTATQWRSDERAVRFSRELEALAVLAERHREEFNTLVADDADSTDLEAYRHQKRESARSTPKGGA